MKSSSEYTVRALDLQTIADLIPLYDQVFGKKTERRT